MGQHHANDGFDDIPSAGLTFDTDHGSAIAVEAKQPAEIPVGTRKGSGPGSGDADEFWNFFYRNTYAVNC